MESKFNFTLSSGSAIKEVKKIKKKDLYKEYYDLSIYKTSIELLRQLYSSTLKAPKHIKYSLLVLAELDLIDVIYKIRKVANSSNNAFRISLLEESVLLFEKFLIIIRVLYELCSITSNGFSILSSKSEDCVRLSQGWLRSLIKQELKES